MNYPSIIFENDSPLKALKIYITFHHEFNEISELPPYILFYLREEVKAKAVFLIKVVKN